MELFGRNTVVYGAGVSGLSAFDLLRDKGADVILYDDYAKNGRCTSSASVFDRADLIVLSPGVSLDKDFLYDARLEGKTVISELELASRCSAAEQIAVTGTNGKTTATMLIDSILRLAGRSSHAVGNIGAPFSAIADKLDALDVAVIEASSFQLECSPNFSPDIAVILNITPDHLTRHKDMRSYMLAKANIFAHQGEQDYLVYNADDDNILSLLPMAPSRKIPFSLSGRVKDGAYIASDFVFFGNRLIMPLEDTDMRGRELEDILAAVAVGMIEGASPYTIAKAIQTFRRPPYRREYIGSLNGIKVFNDSKATNIDSCVSAVEATNTDMVLILGGARMGEDFAALFGALDKSLSKIKYICAVGENSDDILFAAKEAGIENVSAYADMAAALRSGADMAIELGAGAILFSPASKSFDKFSNYKERGKFFTNLARELGVK